VADTRRVHRGVVPPTLTRSRIRVHEPKWVASVCSDALVKLATWNCCGKFDTNLLHLLGLDVDVAVLCEAKAPSQWPITSEGRLVTGLSQRVWAESPKELAVVACAPWTLTLHEAAETAPAWMLPVRVIGPTSFTLVGLWTVV
jgi:hypothetical protein